jgi:hypothetical protein
LPKPRGKRRVVKSAVARKKLPKRDESAARRIVANLPMEK